ncbi:hypothetical protein A0256_18350 [Mucilaginibacter sp. PAMC 26640]|nr:hypothetical protein A0256_18350 [Mucilaginibacter sp. PAMC 26640]
MDKQTFTDDDALLEVKTNELVVLLQKGVADFDRAKIMQEKLNRAFDEALVQQTKSAVQPNLGKATFVNDFADLLSKHQMDSKVIIGDVIRDRVKKIIVCMIGLVMVTLGMAMIIMPAPPYFEMFTIFHFNPNDGVTIMDVISLLIVFTGIYLLLVSILKKQSVAGR